MDDNTPPGMRWASTEAGPVLVKARRKAPEGSLKKRCRVAFEKWKLQHPDVPVRLLKYSVGTFKSEAGKPYALGTPGTGDILVGICGTCLMVETKSLTGRARDTQIAMRADWEATGNPYVMPRTAAEFTDALTQIAAQHGKIF
jgi:hypothetical protein